MSVDDQVAAMPQAVIDDGMLDAMRALGAPPGDGAKIAKMLTLAEHAVKEVRIQPTVISSGVDVFAGFARIAHPYGLTSCAPKS